jgi:tetratricopeptide (TPR) repeat protein
VECLERALDIEYQRIEGGPASEVIDLQPIRNDYGRLLSHYEWLADAAGSLKVVPPKDLLPRVVKAADRWRHLDPEATEVPNRAAAVLRKAGGEAAADLAWEYVTTPLALKPNESGPWTSLAWSLRQEGNWRLADRCYELAFAAEPTNAQLLWDRAQHLQQQGQVAESRKLLRQLADGDWQLRFNGLKAQARQAVEGR